MIRKPSLIIAFFLTLVTLSCSSDEPTIKSIQDDNETLLNPSSKLRSIEEAAQIARDAMGMLNDGSSRAGSIRTFSSNNVQTIISLNSRAENDTLLYVFNFDNEMGYAIVAANKSFNPALLAITENGNYQVGQDSDNPGMKMFMRSAMSIVKDSLKPIDSIPSISIDDPINPELVQYRIGADTTYIADIHPKHYLYWGQHYPEGLLCPKIICGCVPTAALIAMATLGKPTVFTYKHEDGSETTESIPWLFVRKHKKSFLYQTQYDNHECSTLLIDAHGIMSRIARDVYINAHIELDSTCYDSGLVLYSAWTSPSNLANYFIERGMATNDFEGVSDEEFASWLNQGGITIGNIKEHYSSTKSHAIVVDGIVKYLVIYGEWIKEYMKPWVCTNEIWRKTETFYHINWGWNGCDNGYFYAGIYNPNKIVERDPDTGPSYVYTNYTSLTFLKIK